LIDQKLLLKIKFCVAAQDQCATIDAAEGSGREARKIEQEEDEQQRDPEIRNGARSSMRAIFSSIGSPVRYSASQSC
jgi:hypothetical protein